MTRRMHKNELPISSALVRRLVNAHFPEYQNQPLQPLSETGSTNRLFRLGDELVVRLPRQPGGGESLYKEQRWLPHLRPHLPVAVPEFVDVVPPTEEFPEPWAVTVWLPGEPAKPNQSQFPEQLAETIVRLRHTPIPAQHDAALQWYRGDPLAAYDADMKRSIEHCRGIDNLPLDLEAVADLWASTLEHPMAHSAEPAAWYHSDLVAENLLVDNGRLVAVLDFGGLGIGDPTIDLHGAWELFDPGARDAFRKSLAPDDASWMRGRAWAVAIAVGAIAYYWRSLPRRCEDRLIMAQAALDDAQRNPI